MCQHINDSSAGWNVEKWRDEIMIMYLIWGKEVVHGKKVHFMYSYYSRIIFTNRKHKVLN